MERFAIRVMLALTMVCGTAAQADPVPAGTGDPVTKLALEWFGRMKTGEIDRSALSPEYNAHLTAEAVQALLQYLNVRKDGAMPEKAEIMEERSGEGQTIYLVKLTFLGGDASSMLLGLNAQGQITGVMILGLPGS